MTVIILGIKRRSFVLFNESPTIPEVTNHCRQPWKIISSITVSHFSLHLCSCRSGKALRVFRNGRQLHILPFLEFRRKPQRFGNRNCSFPQMIQIQGSCSVGSTGASVQLGPLGQLFSWVCWGSCSVGPVGAAVQLGLLGQLFSWVC